ncbi:MAG TPA: glycosyltransferase [Nitrospiria bacterium]|nr:glycosyltransferase [Nitrospiria bacterium]
MKKGGTAGGSVVGGPLVSVLLPVFNGARHLTEAVDSILNQTYGHFELIAIDDGSTDDSGSVLRRFRDDRIRVYHQSNRGLAATLNRAITLAHGELLARQDQDDVSKRERFERQVDYLRAHPACGLVGTWAEITADGASTGRVHRHPADGLVLTFELLFDNPFVHSSVMIRKRAIDDVGAYSTDPARQPPEDYELWSRIARRWEVANIPEILHVYREAANSMSRTGVRPFVEHLVMVSAENLSQAAGRASVGAAAVDLAALAHDAVDRLSPQPDLEACASLLFEAADRLSDGAGADRALLRRRAEERLGLFRARYDRHRYGAVIGRLITAAGRLRPGRGES